MTARVLADAVGRIYACEHCDETFTKAVKLGGHVHAAHPEHRRVLSVPTRFPARGPRPGGSLKRAGDTWPGRP